jgi:hypothetical protein
MAVSKSLLRLLRIRDLQEEQSRIALASATGELRQLERASVAAGERARRGRRLVDHSALTGEVPDRQAGLEETRAAQRATLFLGPRIEDAEDRAGMLEEVFLARRVERRQAATLIEEAEAVQALETERRAQQSLDDWYRNQLGRREREIKSAMGREVKSDATE